MSFMVIQEISHMIRMLIVILYMKEHSVFKYIVHGVYWNRLEPRTNIRHINMGFFEKCENVFK